MSHVIQVTDANFKQEVVDSDLPVLVDFWAPWCVPCKMIGPIVEKMSDSYHGRLKVVKVDVEENQKVATALGVQSVPTIAIFDSNEVVDAVVGAQPEPVLVKMVDRYLKKVHKIAQKEAKKARKEGKKAAKAAKKNEVA